MLKNNHLSQHPQAHDGGVVAIELSHVVGAAPQLITIGADKTLAIWDTITFKVHIAHLLHFVYFLHFLVHN